MPKKKSNVLEFTHRKRRRKAKITFYEETELAIKSLLITLTLMIIVLSLAFLFSTSKSSQNGYALEQEKNRHEKLINLNESLKAKINSESAFTLMNEEKVGDMTEDTKKIYITEEDNKIQ